MSATLAEYETLQYSVRRDWIDVDVLFCADVCESP